MNRLLTVFAASIGAMLFFSSCEKEAITENQGSSAYVKYKIDGQAYYVEGTTRAKAHWYEMDNGGFRLDPVKWRSTISWGSTYLGEQSELFVIEMIDSAGLRLGHFDAQDFELPYWLNFRISFYGNQGWTYAMSTDQSKSATITITRLDQTWLEGTFSAAFDNGVAVTDCEFRIFRGI